MNDPYVNFLPTYAATAWYHKTLANRPAELQPFLREAEAFAARRVRARAVQGHARDARGTTEGARRAWRALRA